MDDKRRVALVLTDEALAVLDRHASQRKRGEFVSQLLVDYDAQLDGEESGILERMAARLERIEKLLLAGGAG